MTEQKIQFSEVCDPLKWDTDAGVITFASTEDALKAEKLFNNMQQEIERLRGKNDNHN